MGGPQDRRAPRIPAELELSIIGPKGSTRYVTRDVSRGGVYIVTEQPKSLRQLLRLQITLQDGQPPLEVHGMVVRAVEPAETEATGEPAGMGVEFIAFGGEPRQRWENTLRQLQGPVGSAAPDQAAASSQPPSAAPQPAIPQQMQTPDVKIAGKRPKKLKMVRYVFPIRPSTLARREKFKAFIEAGIPEEDVGMEIVEE